MYMHSERVVEFLGHERFRFDEGDITWIGSTQTDLDWTLRVPIDEALRGIFAAYRHEVADAGALIND